MAMKPDEAITTTVTRFLGISGLGKTKTWELIHDGTLKTIVIGRRRLIVLDSYRRLIAAQQTGPPGDARRNNTVPPIGSSKRRGRPPMVPDVR